VITDTVSVTDALYSLDKVSNWSVRNDTEIHWSASNEASQPTDAEITAEINRLQTIYDAKAYARNRATEYPSIADQLDDIYHNGIDAWKATIKTTKDKYPKP